MRATKEMMIKKTRVFQEMIMMKIIRQEIKMMKEKMMMRMKMILNAILKDIYHL
jgi:hypothetical protein